MGAGAVPFVVTKMLPLLWPTQTMSELPMATAIALMFEPIVFLILVQFTGKPLALLVRQRLAPPANKVFGLFGSRMNGAMKFVVPPGTASVMP